MGKFTSQHGPGHAPILVGGKVIFVNEQDEISQVLALDAKTGAVAWKADRNPTRSCYSTPVLRERPDGTQELIVTSTKLGLDGQSVANRRLSRAGRRPRLYHGR